MKMRLLITGAPCKNPGPRTWRGHPARVSWASRPCREGLFRSLFAALVLGSIASVSAAGGKDLFLLAGQSNMAGRGLLNASNRIDTARIEKLTRAGTWAPAEEPIHYDKSFAGAGLAATFARAVADRAPKAEIGLIPCAVGGSGLNEWMPGAPLYTEAVRRARMAQKDGQIRAILWHQGESDADRGPLEKSYGERLAKMVAALREELALPAGEVPFICGEIGEFPKAPYYAGNHSFNTNLPAAISAIPNARLVKAADLTSKPDLIHFDTPSLRTLGLRYAEAYFSARGEKERAR